ncbi:hypothetical protein DSM3645_20422 [Blastopirellula marina DSM 3645]|uniref:Uncharacterized protein n=1 Tax=Blastopirellula marina DSM 3645 TaxID=314230 RepID=A3ZQN6_9BACT|nr:hypothetical protein DSM3645_20422 [Blastopirellula marina DSM 3645]
MRPRQNAKCKAAWIPSGFFYAVCGLVGPEIRYDRADPNHFSPQEKGC